MFRWTPTYWQDWREAPNPYRQFKSERDRSLALQALQLCEGDRVLEVGCGYGWISQVLLESAKISWFGVDFSESMIRQLRGSLSEHRPHAFVADAYHLPFSAELFDKVLCSGVLMHVADEFAVLRELVRVLRPNGILVFTMNNALSPFSVPVRLWNSFKKDFIQNFRLPTTSRRYLERLGLQLHHTEGDSVLAVVSVRLGRFSFPPASLFRGLRSLDHWVVQRFAWLAYEVWFTAVKVSSA